MAHSFAHFAKGWGTHYVRTLFLILTCLACLTARAQNLPDCSLGKITERVPPQYPITLQGRIVEGTVSVLATFSPDGRVSGSKAISGPPALQFEARAYLNGWRAQPASAPRQCIIQIIYQFDGSQGVCSTHTQVAVRPERLDETHVLLHLSCDVF
ncbi:MAG: energy transducer TonB [Acidobacteriaceae bacterium]